MKQKTLTQKQSEIIDKCIDELMGLYDEALGGDATQDLIDEFDLKLNNRNGNE